MCVNGEALTVGTIPKADAASSAFKVVAVRDTGNVMFESVAKPAAFLNFLGRKFILVERKRPDGHWRIAAPLAGKEGVSIQHVPSGRYLVEQKGEWQVVADVESKRGAVLFLEEQR